MIPNPRRIRGESGYKYHQYIAQQTHSRRLAAASLRTLPRTPTTDAAIQSRMNMAIAVNIARRPRARRRFLRSPYRHRLRGKQYPNHQHEISLPTHARMLAMARLRGLPSRPTAEPANSRTSARKTHATDFKHAPPVIGLKKAPMLATRTRPPIAAKAVIQVEPLLCE